MTRIVGSWDFATALNAEKKLYRLLSEDCVFEDPRKQFGLITKFARFKNL